VLASSAATPSVQPAAAAVPDGAPLAPSVASVVAAPDGAGLPSDAAAAGVAPAPTAIDRRPLHRARWFQLSVAVVAVALLAAGTRLAEGPGSGSKSAGQRQAALATAPPPVDAGPWRALRDLPTARQQVAGAVTDGTLWVVGGLSGESGASSKVEGYDPAIDTWKSAPDLPLPLHHAMAVTYRGELVVLGGWTPEGTNLSGTTSNRVFALRSGTWVELPAMLRPRAAGAAAVVGDRIVVVGGQANGALIGPSEVFDGSRWDDAPALPTPRDHLAAVSDGTSLYAVGGRVLSADANLATVERYDPVARHWNRLADMPTARGGLGADIVGRRIVAVGGERPTGVFDTVEAFDLDSGAWSALPAMRTPRHGMAVLAFGSSIYALGGSLLPTHAHAAATAEVLDLRR
jgi:non-specific serine/threonine protein kinase